MYSLIWTRALFCSVVKRNPRVERRRFERKELAGLLQWQLHQNRTFAIRSPTPRKGECTRILDLRHPFVLYKKKNQLKIKVKLDKTETKKLNDLQQLFYNYIVSKIKSKSKAKQNWKRRWEQSAKLNQPFEDISEMEKKLKCLLFICHGMNEIILVLF